MISYRTLVIILIVTTMLLVAGCMEHAGYGKNRGDVPSTVLITSVIPTPMQTETLQVSRDGYWIKIDPISDKQTGDLFIITSTTNGSSGEEILVSIYPLTPFNSPKMQTGEFSSATGTVRVMQGINGINTISFVVNSSTLYNSSPLKPDEYAVSEDAIRREASGSALFKVNPRPIRYAGIGGSVVRVHVGNRGLFRLRGVTNISIST